MNAYSVLADLFRPHGATELPGQEQPTRLLPMTAADELPPCPEQLVIIDGRRRRKLDPTWAVVPEPRW